MKICLLTPGYPRYKGDDSSVKYYLHDLGKNLTKRGIEVHVLAPHAKGINKEEVMDGVYIHRFQYFYPSSFQTLAYTVGVPEKIKTIEGKIQVPFFFLSQLFNTIKLIRKEKIDVINSHWLLPQGLVGAINKKIFKIPHISTGHGSDVHLIKKSKIFSIFCSFVLHNSDKVTANSSYTKNIILSIDDRVKNKLEIVPMGVDINRFKPEDNTNLKEVLEAEYLILSVGRLVDWKGTKYLIIAMKKIIREFPNARLIIGGTGPEKEKLEKLTEELNLKKNVVFRGYIENMVLSKYYASSDIFVLPSINLNGLTEALGVVLLEAMACGTPAIGTNVGGVPDIIKDGYNGFLVEQKNPEQIAEKVLELLDDEELRVRFSKNALETAKKYDWDVIGKHYMKIICSLCRSYNNEKEENV